MFEIRNSLTHAPYPARSLWLWCIEFRALTPLPPDLTRIVEGMAGDLEAALRDMQAAEEAGTGRLVALGFKMKDTSY